MSACRLKWCSKMRVLVSRELKQELVSSRVSELSVRVVSVLKVRAGVASKELEQRPSVKLVALVKLLLSPTFYAKIFLSLFYL